MAAAAHITAEREWNDRFTTGDAEAAVLMDLEATDLGAALIEALRLAEKASADRSEDPTVKRLAERLIDALGPSDDCYLMAEIAGVGAQAKRVA